MIVIDATVLADFFIGAENVKSAAEQLLLEDPEWASPSLWRHELGNVLRTAVRARHLDEATAVKHLGNAEKLVAETVTEIETAEVFALALERGLTMYDASYVWVARASGLKVRTRDTEILMFCPEYALPMPRLAS